jgi:hypothetical protein
VIIEGGLTGHRFLNDVNLMSDWPSDGGMDQVALALEEERVVQIDPILKKSRTMGLHKNVAFLIIRWSR